MGDKVGREKEKKEDKRELARITKERDERTWAVLGNHGINDGGFDAVHDVVGRTGYEVAIAADLYIFLSTENGSFSFLSLVSYSLCDVGRMRKEDKGQRLGIKINMGAVHCSRSALAGSRTCLPCHRLGLCIIWSGQTQVSIIYHRLASVGNLLIQEC